MQARTENDLADTQAAGAEEGARTTAKGQQAELISALDDLCCSTEGRDVDTATLRLQAFVEATTTDADDSAAASRATMARLSRWIAQG